jgi:ferredoxin/flavodoxin
MKGIIYYYSNTGNTELVCKYISEQVKSVRLELAYIAGRMNADINSYDIIGFAFPTHYLGIPEQMRKFIESIKCNQEKHVFLINTYGMMQGKALRLVKKLLDKKGCRVVSWHTLMTPESFPPFIAKGIISNDKPDEKQISAFKNFIFDLSKKLDEINNGTPPKEAKVKIGFLNSVLGVKSADKIRKEMRDLTIDSSLCNECGRCVEYCHYNAISMKKKPVIDFNQCMGCWSCFNHCPQGAIYTEKIKSSSRYNIPQNNFFVGLANGDNSGGVAK